MSKSNNKTDKVNNRREQNLYNAQSRFFNITEKDALIDFPLTVKASAVTSNIHGKSDYDIAMVALLKQGSSQYLSRGDVLELQAEKNVHLLIDGTMALCMSPVGGEHLTLSFLNQGYLIGIEHIWCNDQSKDTYVKAMNECTLATISIENFIALSKKHPVLTTIALKQISMSLTNARDRLYGRSLYPFQDQVARMYQGLITSPKTEEVDDGYVIYTSQIEISKILGCTRWTVLNAIKELQKTGVLTITPKKYVKVMKEGLSL